MVRESGDRIARSATGLVALLFLLTAGIAHTQVTVELSETSLAVGEQLIYDIQIDYEDPEDVVIPQTIFPGFRLTEGPTVRPGTRVSVDQRSRVVEIRLGFVAEVPGRYVLDPVSIEVAGQIFLTPARLVEVGERGDRSRVPFLARWVASPGPMLVGEARSISLEIYNADDFVYPSQISVQPPDQAIFEEVQGLGTIRQTVIDGVTLYQIPVAVFMVTPSATGVLQIMSAEVEWEGLTATAPAVSFQVDEPPAPIAASGAIGEFSLSASVDRASLSSVESAILVVRLDGVGNLHYLRFPEVSVNGFLVESEERTERLSPSDSGYSGFREVRFVLRPTATGSGQITVEAFSHFDPSQGRVVRTRIPGFDLQITSVKEPVTDSGPLVSFELLRSDQIAAVEPWNWYRNPVSYGAFAPGLLFLLAFRLWRRRGAQATLVALVAFFFIAAASDYLPWAQINRGLELYDSGDQAGATDAFEIAARQAPESPGIQHNLAVLYYKSGDIGRSVYAAREAVRFNPSSGEIRATQQLIERAAGLERSVPPRHLVHPDVVFVSLAAAVNILFVLLAFLGRTKRQRRAGLLAIGQILVGALTLSLIVGLLVAAQVHKGQVAVVLEELSLRRIPSQTAESWLDLDAGTALEIVSRKDDFVLVRTDLGLEGWVTVHSVLWPENPDISALRYSPTLL